MNITEEVKNLIGQPESQSLEYKAVLPPSRTIAQIISSFANTDGGFLILGVTDDRQINGISIDFHATGIVHKALDSLSPKPQAVYQYINISGKKLYVVKVQKSDTIVTLEDKVYVRVNDRTTLSNPVSVTFEKSGYERINIINDRLLSYLTNVSSSKVKFIEHYQSVLKIVDDLQTILYPDSPDIPTENPEGKILNRILFSSVVDNFETYLSDLLFEIFLAEPNTLKNSQTVTIEEVLNCSDIQEFVKYWAKRKISKLQKGSVKGFIKDTKQIRELNVIDDDSQFSIEKILQIRHLYSHRNGIVDEKFLQYYSGEFDVNTEHKMSVKEVFDKLDYLMEIVHLVDQAAINKYSLSTSN